MDRRNFFKGMFGAAIVASMPKIVVDQIEKAEQIAPKHNDLSDIQGGISPSGKEQLMYLYDDNRLIASSSEFKLNYKRESIRVPPDSYPEYYLSEMSWDVEASLFWNNRKAGLDYFAENKPLQCVIYNKGLKIKGNVYITCCILSNGSLDYPYENVMLSGVGALIIDVENE
jgi:hypothetical protein